MTTYISLCIYLFISLSYFMASVGARFFSTVSPLKTTPPSTDSGTTLESVTKPFYQTTIDPYTDPPIPGIGESTIRPFPTGPPTTTVPTVKPTKSPTVKPEEVKPVHPGEGVKPVQPEVKPVKPGEEVKPVQPEEVKPVKPGEEVKPVEPEEGSSVVGLKSKQKCKEYGEFVYIKEWDDVVEKYRKRDTCEIIEPLIVGGNDTVPREFPHQAMIGWGPLQAYPQWYCGGSLISPSYILTAGHCRYMDPKRPPTVARWIRLGDYKIDQTDDEDKGHSKPITMEVGKFIPHDEYSVLKNDIALIKMKSEVTFNEYIRPACLHTERVIPKSYGLATGWGKLKYGMFEPNAIDKKLPLQKVNLTFTRDAECVRLFSGQSGNNESTMFCAGGRVDSGKDTCQGDSGGPLQIRLRDPYCMYSIVGVTSFGVNCSIGYPGVFARVSHYISWIEKIVWPELV